MTTAAPTMTPADLEGVLARIDSSVLLVPPRILRRVIKQDRGLGGLGLQVPHYKTYVIGRDALLQIASRDELDVSAERVLPETVILLKRPDTYRLRSKPIQDILRIAWRLLFHARVHVAFADRKLTDPAVVDRIRRLGTAVFTEARSVLIQENFLLPPGDERTIYEEFAAVYLELRYFARHLVPRYFPAIGDFDAVDRLLAEDVDAEELYARTRPEGASEPAAVMDHAADRERYIPDEPFVPATGRDQEAASASARGNDVRAARLHFRSGRRSESQDAVRRLTARLQKALHFPPAEAGQWETCLFALVETAGHRLWPAEARLLYDLQKACINQEKDIYALDLVEWAVTWGQRPVKRLLPLQPYVLTVKNLRRALNRLTVANLPDDARHVLHRLLEHSLHHAEKRLRERFRPLIRGALEEVDLRPDNYPERIARDTIVEELLDRVVDRGFLTMSDLRDAIARNRLKLPDVANPIEVILGDKLLKANRKMAVALDGVYRRGEIYMRWLQRLSSVFFGTTTGRCLVLYLILPVLCGAFAVKGPKLFWDELRHYGHLAMRIVGMGDRHGPPETAGAEHQGGHHFLSQDDIVPIAVASVFMLGVFHVPVFRRLVLAALRWTAWAIWYILHDIPALFFELPTVRRFLQSRPYLLAYQFLFKPVFWGEAVWLVLWFFDAETAVCWYSAGGTFVVAELLLNSRLGQGIEETATDGLVRGWHLLKTDLLPGAFRRIMAFFKWLVEGVDRLIYMVDEWLRFRPGDSRLSLYTKPVVGLLWFLVTYVVRFAVNLLIEPQINPIKHFPVVTVSHKILLPMIPMLSSSLGISKATTTMIVFGIPGIFGFIAWELRENWKLYRANQADDLQAVTIGSHGETMLRLMRPGFHSGTLPKLYAKLRRYERRHHAARARKRREELHHVEEAVRHFAERNLVHVLEGSHGWRLKLFVGAVQAATDQVRIEIVCTGEAAQSIPPHGPHRLDGTETAIMRRLEPTALEVSFEEQSGWLTAGLSKPGWLDRLGRDERLALSDALAGFYKLAGVNLVSEQVAAALPAGATWVMDEDRLTVWQDGRAAAYGLTEATLPWDRLRFDRVALRWVDWVGAWQRDQDGKGHEPPLLPEVRLLP